MLFEKRLREGIHSGDITVVFRRWPRPQVVVGGHYRTGLDLIEVLAVDAITEDAIGARDARKAGYATAAEVVADLNAVHRPRFGSAPTVAAGPEELYRIRLRRLDEPDPRDTLAASASLTADDVAGIDRRLDRIDRASHFGAWTRPALHAIATGPGVRAADLAASMDLDTAVFKRNIRTLKGLGLTLSLETGYRLSPRGEAYLRASARRPATH